MSRYSYAQFNWQSGNLATLPHCHFAIPYVYDSADLEAGGDA